MPIILSGATSGTVTIDTPAVAGSNTLTVPASTGTVLTSVSPASDLPSSIKGPSFYAYLSASTQSINSAVNTKVTLDGELWDTNSNFASSRFTPTIAGYYQLNANALFNSIGSGVIVTISIYKNGSEYSRGVSGYLNNTSGDIETVSTTLAYANGSTDYFEVYVYQNSGSSKTLYNAAPYTSFNGFLARSA